MGRFVIPIKVSNILHPDHTFECRTLVDTGASGFFLPEAWRDRVGPLEIYGMKSLLLGDQRVIEAQSCGPVRVDILGFHPIVTPLTFLPLEPEEGDYLAILGFIPLEQAGAAVDCLNQRLIKVPFELRRAG